MSLENPILSVIVLSFNHKEYIDKCLESIFRQQTEYSYEILLADDCSVDGTAGIVAEKYGERIKILDRKENLGLCKNMYDAYMQADGKYIFTCSGDDYLPQKNILNRQVRYLEEHGDVFSVTGWHENYFVDEGKRRTVEVPYKEYTLLDFLRGKKVLFLEGMMRNTFKEDRPEYLCRAGKNNEEIQMFYYLFSKGKKVILPEICYTYCYRKKANNYNSTHSFEEMLNDYVQGFRAVERVDQKKHNFALAKVTYYQGCIDYLIQDHGLGVMISILKILGLKDILSFAQIKLLKKMYHGRVPEFLLCEKRLMK